MVLIFSQHSQINILSSHWVKYFFKCGVYDFPPVVIGEECIKLVKDAKLLGVTISGDLTWNAHISEVTKKAAKRLYFLVQLKRACVPQKDLCLFYITCVPSVIDYAAPVFHCGAWPQHLHAQVWKHNERPEPQAKKVVAASI